ncbi:fumarylacetoacetate hydrolase family protein [Amycolatopsis saalfeldensis]|uniref:2-keto-4-pentenoate hydratase/2-oxohepta-3-ene-1,7-dioic acid hydratase (Catechol pathway) n=1 Tax=Amycolatopsis saalfeldensis TaxID=394193 RepID=A0A1H8YPW4_9PSEU|nr:fumarylacetoacetate hydrolase family protein [Amycolatopsis saalfeldensis]SEP54265.1 2-keto-4-pentenoate hydratase/2-oxohepta-3-ene-1,7-dioic acid hydratase (catechol pathway) [Amycolatopsis saalfeldensis]
MRISSYRGPDGLVRVGIWQGERLHPVPGASSLIGLLGDDGSRLRAGAVAAAGEPGIDPAAVELLAPVPVPPSIRDFMAFEEHVVTSTAALGQPVDPLWYELPVFYFTNPAAARGAHADVEIAPGSAALDYEIEVAAVIGRAGADLSPDEAVDHIAGFTLFCDWSNRDLQAAEMRVGLGPAKGKDSASSFGPWLVTADEFAALASGRGYDVELTGSVGGVPYSSGNLAALYWSFGEMIAYASRGTRVVPGDVIASGTVGTGCILELSRVHGAGAYPYLRPGDRVRLDGGLLGAIDARIREGRPVLPFRPARR